jgi:hypothetical protein
MLGSFLPPAPTPSLTTHSVPSLSPPPPGVSITDLLLKIKARHVKLSYTITQIYNWKIFDSLMNMEGNISTDEVVLIL